jgi:trk system potassium uptake protein
VAAQANVGSGVGDTSGEAGNVSIFSDLKKRLMSFGMIVKRLELFTVDPLLPALLALGS